MIPLKEQSERFHQLNSLSNDTLARMLQYIGTPGSERLVPAGEKILPGGTTEKLMFLVEGTLRCMRDGQVLFHYEPGEILGIEFKYFGDAIVIEGDFAVRVQEFSSDAFTTDVLGSSNAASLWFEHLAIRLNLLSELFASGMKHEIHAPPAVLTAQAGDVIVEQGDMANEVFTLLEGSCDVLVNSQVVGEVRADEIFGALGVVAAGSRTASVVAREPIVYLSVPKDKFLELIENRPSTVFKLIQDMTRTIVALNGKVVDGTASKI